MRGSCCLITVVAGLVGSHSADLLVREEAGEIVVLHNLARIGEVAERAVPA